MTKRKLLLVTISLLLAAVLSAQEKSSTAQEMYRPQFHFSPREHWMNDPNGLIFYKGVYHIFFQYYPEATVWGPMHWGHATSTDLFHWKELPIALYPDTLGYIFSGSAVVDAKNTSGFGKDGKTPLVAIFTYHNPVLEKAKRKDFQYQGLAFSLDDGMTWTKYAGNPVLPNPGITDFRDPKVSWYAPQQKWIMTLATKDRISFFGSKNLKQWEKLSEFGLQLGAHSGVWECPDLMEMDYQGRKTWVLLVSINPGGPNGGSATQYFLGNFDGIQFTPTDTATRWIDFGTDNYAGVSFFNSGNRKIFLGWMSNWQYATQVPTLQWRSAMTIPRTLSLKSAAGKLYLASSPVTEMKVIKGKSITEANITSPVNYLVAAHQKNENGLFQLDLDLTAANNFSILLDNETGEKLVIGFDHTSNKYYIDRSKSGVTSFEAGFAKKHFAPRLSTGNSISISLVFDQASVELFADDGLTVMTDVVFPKNRYTALRISTEKGTIVRQLQYTILKSSIQ
ncbi:glycoside hydrolase family 32 protein [Flavihumibacter profundi]|jgi:fructan beta-fructosidase|uniref:glycoside hydrolase family 32 protein n=1 Tax=Flavihumibacter profundi TaxID=2716883 RepID=UPI001CC60018|nr:glycoside hydrolase family 32 protein [Flavihumibacter profundi]MBZ5859536.1 glycoside hydrolase family 32 protein [Flavihumibacter profundi]